MTNRVDFHGEGYDQKHDGARLTGKLEKLRALMADGAWRTLEEIETRLKQMHPGENFPQASVSAALRYVDEDVE